MPLLTHIARANDGTLLVRPPRFTHDARMIHLSYLSSPHPSRSSFLDCALLPSLTRFLKVASTEHTVDGTDLEPYKRRAKNTLLRELGDAPHGSKFSIETPPYVFQYVQWSSAARRSCCCDVIPPHREATWPTCGTPSSPPPPAAPHASVKVHGPEGPYSLEGACCSLPPPLPPSRPHDTHTPYPYPATTPHVTRAHARPDTIV